MENTAKYDVLKQYFGHDSFRNGQGDIIDNILSGNDVLGIMPTGAGKSVCYQVPAMLLDGITVVISPLISLMKDQVGALVQAGVPAAYINSSLNYAQCREVFRRAYNGAYKIIYAAPERLITDEFIAFAGNMKIAMVTVDEAHCVSQWGQDFRPSYLKISEFIQNLSYRPILSAFTATATKTVKDDIEKMLKLNSPYTVTTGFDRENLYFEVRRPEKKLNELLALMNENRDKCSIIYCISRKNVEEVCEALCDNGYAATRYHAGLSDEERRINQDDFIFDRKNIMVATNAFGMGIDKSNVSLIVHYNMPKNLEGYYQEAGRAGRDGEPASCIMLYSGGDVRTNEFMIKKSMDENTDITDENLRSELLKRDLKRLKEMTFYCTTSDCLRSYILKYFGEKGMANCGNCSSCCNDYELQDITVDAQKIVSCVIRIQNLGRAVGKALVTDVLRGKNSEKIQNYGFDKLSTFGIMKDAPVQKIRMEMEFLENNEILFVTDGDYPVITAGKKAAEFIHGKSKLEMKLPKVKIKAVYVPKSEQAELSNELLNKLKELRQKIAVRVKMPAYIIFTDASLRDMCRKLPVTEGEFLGISGVGRVKCKLYGEDFMNIIRAYGKK